MSDVCCEKDLRSTWLCCLFAVGCSIVLNSLLVRRTLDVNIEFGTTHVAAPVRKSPFNDKLCAQHYPFCSPDVHCPTTQIRATTCVKSSPCLSCHLLSSKHVCAHCILVNNILCTYQKYIQHRAHYSVFKNVYEHMHIILKCPLGSIRWTQ